MNILITGYTGFIGSNLTQKLQNHTLLGLDIARSNMVSGHFKWNEPGNWPDADCIIHLAGKAHDTRNKSAEKEYFDINIGLTQKIFDFFLESKAQKFIFFSSVKAVADTVESEILTEEVLPNPKTPYGKSKLEAEKYILSHRLPSNKKVYILRPCMVHGPGNKGNLNLLYKVINKGIPWPLGAFPNKRSFTSINNLVFVIHQILDNKVIPGIYQIADDEPVSTEEIIEIISASLNKRIKIWQIPKWIIKAFAKTGDIFRLPLNSESLKKLTENYLVSNNKLKKAAGIDKMPVSAKEGLKITFDSFKTEPVE